MRTFEYIIVILDLILLLLLLFPERRPRFLLPVTGFLALVVIVVHLVVEGFRWQMFLAYGLTAILLLAALIQGRSPTRKQIPLWRVLMVTLLGLFLILLATALPFILPVPQLPEPGGPYPIGTETYHLVDKTRPEIYGDNPGGDRELMLQVWYPAEPGASGVSAPWFDQLDVAASIISERLGLPSFFLGHINLAETHSLSGAAPNGEGQAFPLVMFSHGLNGLRMQNTAQFEELASHGYVIASIDHTFDSVITILPGDRAIVHHGSTVMPEGISTIQSGRQLLSVRVQDLFTALGYLENHNRNPESLLYQQIDLEKIGIMGHSTGGGTAIEFCAQSAQCRAVLALDSWIEPVSKGAISQALSQPSMFLNTTEWLGNENQAIGQQFFALQDQDSYLVSIEKMGHNNFSDVPLITPLAAQIGLAGPINGAYGIQILNDYSLAFFNRYLLGIDSVAIDEIAGRYTEVTLQAN